MLSIGVGDQQAQNFMDIYRYNDWEQKLGGTLLAEIRVRVHISWSKSLGLIGTPELGRIR